jgi:hypothetical protein
MESRMFLIIALVEVLDMLDFMILFGYVFRFPLETYWPKLYQINFR